MRKFLRPLALLIGLFLLPCSAFAQYAADPSFGTDGSTTETFAVSSRGVEIFNVTNEKTLTIATTSRNSTYGQDEKTDIAVWRPSTGVWYMLKSQTGLSIFEFGQAGDIPLAPFYYRQ